MNPLLEQILLFAFCENVLRNNTQSYKSKCQMSQNDKVTLKAKCQTQVPTACLRPDCGWQEKRLEGQCLLPLHLIWRVEHETGLFEWQGRPENVEAGLQCCCERSKWGEMMGMVEGKQTQANTACSKHGEWSGNADGGRDERLEQITWN